MASVKNMKTTFPTEVMPDQALPDNLVEELTADGLLPEYNIDYSQARPNRFAQRENVTELVRLDVNAGASYE